METDIYTVCEGCGVQVDAAAPNVVRAFEQQVIAAMGIGRQRIDRLPVLFHRGCYPGGHSYRLDLGHALSEGE